MAPALAPDSISFGHVTTNKFHILVQELSRTLGPSSGLTCSDVDISRLTKLMEDYESRAEEWRRYAFADFSRGYTRNLVDEGNGKSNLLVLVWTPGKSSPIHDHADAHCLMKILRGSLRETRYAHPANAGERPTVIKETIYKEGQVTYMNDGLGLHKIGNVSSEELAVSLHQPTTRIGSESGVAKMAKSERGGAEFQATTL